MVAKITTPFQFKQFSVAHDKCAMKVNTDGVLLGAWQDVSDAKYILDIGTGTGVIALMMAQKNSHAIIDAIEIDEAAYIQAKQNFSESKWTARINVFQSSLQDFSSSRKYDLIISNPPYFIDDFVSGNYRQNIAKHTISLTYEDLIIGIERLMMDEGRALLVIPAFNFEKIQALGSEQNLFVSRLTEVIAVQGKQPYLILIQFGRKEIVVMKDSIKIQNLDGSFTKQYKELTKDFYLKF